MDQKQSDFLKLVAPAAIATMRVWGVPASVTIAQAILESSNNRGWGQSSLAVQANNYFGIKATDTVHPENYIARATIEYINGIEVPEMADFARYKTVEGSFQAHAMLLARADRYQPAMSVKSNPELFCNQLQSCGYSTNRPPLAKTPPFYADTLIFLIKHYDLSQYDIPPSLAALVNEPGDPATVTQSKT